MAEALSASTTFQTLVARVADLEDGVFTGTGFSFVIGGVSELAIGSTALTFLGDNSFALSKSGTGNPRLVLDNGDYIQYDRTANKFQFVVGSTVVASIDGSGNLKTLGTITASTTP